MAKTKAKSKDIDYAHEGMQLGLGIAGGVLANQATNFIERQTFMQGKEQYAPLATLAIGIGGYFLAPEGMKPLFYGMTIVSGTEQVEGLLAKAMNSSAAPAPGQMQGNGNFYGRLGFTPQYMPEYKMDSVVRANNGIVIR